MDTNHSLSKVNLQLHFLWMLLFLMVVIQLAWWLLSFFQRNGFVGMWIMQLSR